LLLTIGFLFLVPFVIGILTVRPMPAPGWGARLLAPLLPCTICMVIAGIMGWEGSICLVMAAPVWLVMGSLGGLAGGYGRPTSRSIAPVLAAPLVLIAIEQGIDSPRALREVQTAIRIAAPPDVVWRQVIRVPAIAPAELPWSFVYSIGFPRPIEATLSHEGVGGVRHASFERGVVFIETIDDWVAERRLAFHFHADPATIPPTALDEHVTVGGPFFDVLEGRYELEPVPGGVVLHLASRHRLSTHFNFYAGLWTDAVMRSVQETILAVLKARAEAAA